MKKFIILFTFFLMGSFPLTSQAQHFTEYLEVNIQPYMGNFPSNGVAIPFLTIYATARDTDVAVQEIIISRQGLSAGNDFSRVWAEADFFQKSRRAVFSHNDVARLAFSRPVIIPAGKTIPITVYANVEDFPTGRTAFFMLDDMSVYPLNQSAEQSWYPSYQSNFHPTLYRRTNLTSRYRTWHLQCDFRGCRRIYDGR